MGVLNALGLPPGAGMALGFVAGLGIGSLLSPFGLVAIPLLVWSQASKGGASAMLMSEYDNWVNIYPVEDDRRTIASVFSRAPYFAVTRGKQLPGELVGIYPNPYKNRLHNSSRLIVDYLLQFTPNEVIVKNIGINAENLLKQAGVLISKVQ